MDAAHLVEPTHANEPRSVQTRVGTATWNKLKRYCPKYRAAFFPSVSSAGDRSGNYSPEVLKTIVYAGTQIASFAQGSATPLRRWKGCGLPPSRSSAPTEKIGQERVDPRDEAVQRFLALPLMDRCKSPVANPLPESNVATVMMVGGRLQILDRSKRDSDQPETVDNDPPEPSGHWREDKIGSLMTMTSKVSIDDPCPKIPENFRFIRLKRAGG